MVGRIADLAFRRAAVGTSSSLTARYRRWSLEAAGVGRDPHRDPQQPCHCLFGETDASS